MAKLPRVTNKRFGANANLSDVGQFGGAAAGTKLDTKDIAAIQALPAWSSGWAAATMSGNKYPTRQERNGVDYVHAYQIDYMLREGMPEYDSQTEYSNTSIVKAIEDDKVVFYHSIINNNIGQSLDNTAAWEKVEMSGSSRNIGEVVVSTIPLTDAGLHLLDGALISGSGSYSAFVSYMADLYNSGDYSARFTTEANWQASVASNGLCSQFVYDSVNNTVRLPKWGNIAYTKQYTLTLASYVPVRGNGIALGITNGTDLLGLSNSSPNGLSVYTGLYGKGVGATWSGTNPTVANLGTGVTTDGTKSGLVANTSGVAAITNDPLSCYYYIVVATSTKTDIQVDIDEIATDLNGKADVDLTNISNAGNIKTAHNATPSGTYKDLTLGASGSAVTAPADGYVRIQAGGLTSLQLYSGGLSSFDHNGSATTLACSLPIKKSSIITVYYGGGTPSNVTFRFIYAVGSVSEAS